MDTLYLYTASISLPCVLGIRKIYPFSTKVKGENSVWLPFLRPKVNFSFLKKVIQSRNLSNYRKFFLDQLLLFAHNVPTNLQRKGYIIKEMCFQKITKKA